jgi:hypothetical protein
MQNRNGQNNDYKDNDDFDVLTGSLSPNSLNYNSASCQSSSAEKRLVGLDHRLTIRVCQIKLSFMGSVNHGF